MLYGNWPLVSIQVQLKCIEMWTVVYENGWATRTSSTTSSQVTTSTVTRRCVTPWRLKERSSRGKVPKAPWCFGIIWAEGGSLCQTWRFDEIWIWMVFWGGIWVWLSHVESFICRNPFCKIYQNMQRGEWPVSHADAGTATGAARELVYILHHLGEPIVIKTNSFEFRCP